MAVVLFASAEGMHFICMVTAREFCGKWRGNVNSIPPNPQNHYSFLEEVPMTRYLLVVWGGGCWNVPPQTPPSAHPDCLMHLFVGSLCIWHLAQQSHERLTRTPLFSYRQPYSPKCGWSFQLIPTPLSIPHIIPANPLLNENTLLANYMMLDCKSQIVKNCVCGGGGA